MFLDKSWKKQGHWDSFHLHYFNLSSINDLAKNYYLRIVSKTGVGKYTKLKNIFQTLLCSEISLELTHDN